jgi:hypothetical protein
MNTGTKLAVRQGFEPWVQLYTVQRFSKPPPSATRPPHQSKLLRIFAGLAYLDRSRTPYCAQNCAQAGSKPPAGLRRSRHYSDRRRCEFYGRSISSPSVRGCPRGPCSGWPFAGNRAECCLEFWNARDPERKLAEFQVYYNAACGHTSLEGHTPLGFASGRTAVRVDQCLDRGRTAGRQTISDRSSHSYAACRIQLAVNVLTTSSAWPSGSPQSIDATCNLMV